MDARLRPVRTGAHGTNIHRSPLQSCWVELALPPMTMSTIKRTKKTSKPNGGVLGMRAL